MVRLPAAFFPIPLVDLIPEVQNEDVTTVHGSRFILNLATIAKRRTGPTLRTAEKKPSIAYCAATTLQAMRSNLGVIRRNTRTSAQTPEHLLEDAEGRLVETKFSVS